MDNSTNNFEFETNSLHTGYNVDSSTNSRAVPIYQTTSYVFNNTKHAADLFALKEEGNIYSRINNPTNDVLEKRISDLEGGIGGLVFSSGSAAITATFLTLLKSGDHIVSSSDLYGGTYNLFKVFLPRLGIETTFVNQDDPENFSKAIKKNTRAIFTETIGNPKLDVPDFEKISNIAQENQIPLIVDNTVATPFLCNPIKWGANIVIHSLTKYIGGHGTSLGGIIVDGGNFNWGNGKFDEFTTPSEAYHGLKYWDTLKESSFIAKARLETLRDTGACLSPFNAFQILQGTETLSLRLKQHSENAFKVAEYLQNNERVKLVNYPGLLQNSNYHTALKYLRQGFGGLVTFEVKGGYDEAKKITDKVKLFSLLANIGDTKSLIIHPASTTHGQLTSDEQISSGVTPGLIRLSIGLENITDIINDLEQAFND